MAVQPKIGSQTQQFRQFSGFFELGHSLISKAVTHDERKQTNAAISEYTKGVTQLSRALAYDESNFPSNEKAEVRSRLSKSAKTYQQASDRLTKLKREQSVLPFNRIPDKAQASIRASNARKSSDSPKRTIDKTSSKLKNIDPKIASTILDEVLDSDTNITWDDVAGQQATKQALQEIVILPALRPDLFMGLRAPCKGLLLFGPPGNGKTMLAKAVAHEAKSTFFCISASSLTSKWVGESEKLVRALFLIARDVAPSIIFIDEIDSILKMRSDNENESSRRLKNEFLSAFDGVSSGKEQVLVMAATNRPHDLDTAALRRFPKRIYLPLPDVETRFAMIDHLFKKYNNKISMTQKQIMQLSQRLEGYSCSDIASLAQDAAMQAIRELGPNSIVSLNENEIRGISMKDFEMAMKRIRPSVPQESLNELQAWNNNYGEI